MTYSVQFGPFHPSLPSPVRLDLQFEGTIVRQAEILPGYGHRGLEAQLASNNYQQDIGLVERYCACGGFAAALAFAQAVEEVAHVTPTPRGLLIRTILAEIERLQRHFIVIARGLSVVGLESLCTRFRQLREHVADVTESICGNRVMYDMVSFGGVSRDISSPQELASAIAIMKDSAHRLVDDFIHNNSVAARMVGIGVMTLETAADYGVVGPAARGSGLQSDVRQIAGYAAYDVAEANVIMQTGGDVFSRFAVRALECLESIRLIEDAASRLSEGPFVPSRDLPLPNGTGVSRVEAPSGETFITIMGDGTEIPRRVHIRPASFVNLGVLPKILVGQELEDVAIIAASFDACTACLDR